MTEIPFTSALLRFTYAHGYFPMPHPETDEVLWFKPDPRAIIPLDRFHCSRSLRRTMRNRQFEVTINSDFRGVMAACADREDTWISGEFQRVYGELHDEGFAHSVEVREYGDLVGGLYGVSLRGAFFAESKFHRANDASKVALYHLVRHMRSRGMSLLEVQFMTPHLATLGTVEVSALQYESLLAEALSLNVSFV